MNWTERYLVAALRGIPERQRPDVERELRSSIDDAIEERVANGEARDAAERAVLEGLGDPGTLATGYTGKPNYLIGPELYPLWRSTMIRVIAVATPFAVAIIAGLEFMGGGNYADVILAAGSALFEVPLQILLWGTLAFAFMDRADAGRHLRADVLKLARPWSLELLPDTSPKRVSASEAAGEIVNALITTGIFIFVATLRIPGENGPHELLHGAFTNFFYPVLLASLLARVALQIFAFAVGRWTTYLAIVNALLHLIFAIPIIWFALDGQLIDNFFADGIGWPSLPDAHGLPMLAVALGVTLATGWEIVRGFHRARPSLGLDARVLLPR